MVKTLIMIQDWETSKLTYLEVSTSDINNPFTLNENDVAFIEQSYNEEGKREGDLECIVEHGLINVHWKPML